MVGSMRYGSRLPRTFCEIGLLKKRCLVNRRSGWDLADALKASPIFECTYGGGLLLKGFYFLIVHKDST